MTRIVEVGSGDDRWLVDLDHLAGLFAAGAAAMGTPSAEASPAVTVLEAVAERAPAPGYPAEATHCVIPRNCERTPRAPLD